MQTTAESDNDEKEIAMNRTQMSAYASYYTNLRAHENKANLGWRVQH